MAKRTCGSCTKCCEGHLVNVIKGIPIFPGSPCQFVAPGSGCTIYKDRPEKPCKTYSCMWLSNLDVPEWMKPDLVNVIIDERIINDIPYIHVKEAGGVLPSSVLTWIIKYAMANQKNITWEVQGGKHVLGTPEFLKAINEPIVIQG